MKIVVRSSSQSCKDYIVECDSSWTIIQLKENIKEKHILHPAVEHQKLIYRGRYVVNDEHLKDLFDENIPSTIVHLVLSASSDALKSRKVEPITSSVSNANDDRPPIRSNSTLNTSTTTSNSTDHGTTLRNRSAPFSGQQQPNQYNNYWTPDRIREYYQQQYTTSYPYHQAYSNSSNYTTEQYNLMWRQYHQHYANYMQYYGNQHPAFQTGGVTTATDSAGAPDNIAQQQAPPQVGAAMPENVAAPQPPPNPAPAANANFNPAMNAQGGGFVDDDGMQRDWLDVMFTMLRGGFFLSIIYFYSTLQRFVFVMSCVILVYIYQTGMFRRRPAAAAQQPEPAAANNNNNDDQQRDNNDDENNNNPANSEDNPDAIAGEDGEEDEEVLPPPPSLLATACTFISTFFTSLLPQAPPAVN